MIRWIAHKIRTHNHRHDWVMHAFKLPRPEGGTYYQFRCSRCRLRKGDRHFKPARIISPSVLFSLKVPLDLMPALESKAQDRNEAPVDYLSRLVRRELCRP